MSLIAILEEKLKKVIELEGDNLISWFIKETTDNAKLNLSYFNEIIPWKKDKISKAQTTALSQVLLKLGYDGDKFIKGGFLHDLSRISNPIKKLKAEAVKAVSIGKGYQEFVNDIDNFINGQDGKSGIIESHFRTNAYDTFQQIDRTIQKNMVRFFR